MRFGGGPGIRQRHRNRRRNSSSSPGVRYRSRRGALRHVARLPFAADDERSVSDFDANKLSRADLSHGRIARAHHAHPHSPGTFVINLSRFRARRKHTHNITRYVHDTHTRAIYKITRVRCTPKCVCLTETRKNKLIKQCEKYRPYYVE